MTALIARFAIVALFATLAVPAFSQDNPVVAKVDGTEIRQSDLNAAEEDLGPNLPAMTPEAKRDYLLTYVTDMMIVAKAAEARKLADTDDFKRRLSLALTKLLRESLLHAESKASVNDAAMNKLYQ